MLFLMAKIEIKLVACVFTWFRCVPVFWTQTEHVYLFFGFYPQRVNESLSGLERGRVWKICVDYDIAQIPVPGSKVFSRKNTAGYSCARSISGLCTADTASTGSVLRVIPDSQDFGVRYCGYTLYFF